MLARTWPYGTVKTVKVEDVKRVRYNGQVVWMTVATDTSDGEGYILLGDRDGAEKNDVGQITFTQGGPTGGFWKYKKAGS